MRLLVTNIERESCDVVAIAANKRKAVLGIIAYGDDFRLYSVSSSQKEYNHLTCNSVMIKG